MCEEGEEQRESAIKERYRVTESTVTFGVGGGGCEDDDEYGDASLCLIMSLLMLILPSDASHFIKGLTFACNSQTSNGVLISSRVQEMSVHGIGYEQTDLIATKC